MNYLGRLSFERKAAALFILFFAVAAAFVPGNRRDVYQAYDDGTRRVIIGMTPYPAAEGQATGAASATRFDGGPLFAYLFSPFSTHHGLGPDAGGYVWAMLGFFAFMAGVWALLSLIDGERKLLRKKWFVLSLFLLAGEMPGSVMTGHNGAFAAGVMMLGAVLYMRGYKGRAAFLLAAGANIKLFPLLMALFLALEFGWGFIAAFAGFAGGLFLLPVPVMGAFSYGTMLAGWLDAMTGEALNAAHLGLEPTLLYYGFNIPRAEFLFFTLANFGALALASYHLLKKDRREFVRLVMPALLGFVVLFNRRAESHSFIVIAPVFVFMLHAALVSREEGDDTGFRANMLFIAAAWILLWWGYSPFSSSIFSATAEAWHFKTLGAALMYLWAWARIVMHFSDKMQAEGTVIPVAGGV